jgi:AcrR family transcriptional regulator
MPASTKTAKDGNGDSRPRAAHLGPERRRPLVLDAALEIFVREGYPGTSMDAIAQAAGVSKPVVYACYESKDVLFRALLEREEKRLLDGIAGALPRDLTPAEPMRLLDEGFKALFDAAAASPNSWRVVFDSEHVAEPAVARRVRRARSGVTGQLVEFLRPVLEAGGVEESERLAPVYAEVLTAVAEAGVRVLLRDDEWEPAELASVLSRATVQGPFPR